MRISACQVAKIAENVTMARWQRRLQAVIFRIPPFLPEPSARKTILLLLFLPSAAAGRVCPAVLRGITGNGHLNLTPYRSERQERSSL